ncbi:MAG: hypothetical protein V1799_00810 [bacterium]
MNTTAIVIEHLVIGIQTALWIVCVIFAIYGYQWIPVLTLPSQLFVVMLSLLVVYPLGVFIDEVSDRMFRNWSLKIRRKYVHDDKQTAFKLLVKLKDSPTTLYFQYLRSRIRIARSSTVNIPLLTVAVIFLTVRQFSSILREMTAGVVIIEATIGAIVTLLALFSWQRVSDTFAKRIQWGFEALKEQGGRMHRHAQFTKRTN